MHEIVGRFTERAWTQISEEKHENLIIKSGKFLLFVSLV